MKGYDCDNAIMLVCVFLFVDVCICLWGKKRLDVGIIQVMCVCVERWHQNSQRVHMLSHLNVCLLAM